METMTKVVKLGKVDGYGNGRKSCAVDIEVELREQSNGALELSICGEIWNALQTDIISGGQNLEEIASYFPGSHKVRRIVEVWRRWHLNTMKAGCEHQRAAGWDKAPIDPEKPTHTYGRHFEGQNQPSWNLLGWVREDEHPDGLMCRACWVCGYKYGTAWLTEELPAEIIEEVRSW
jgi:hypothetical protein